MKGGADGTDHAQPYRCDKLFAVFLPQKAKLVSGVWSMDTLCMDIITRHRTLRKNRAAWADGAGKARYFYCMFFIAEKHMTVSVNHA